MEKRIVKNSMIIILLYGITKVAGFAKEMLLANYYGASMITDAYNLVVTMSSTFFEGITTAIVVGYLGVIAKERSQNKINDITSQIVSVFGTCILIISIIATIFVEQTCGILAVGFDKQTMDITVKMARLILPFSVLYVSKNVINGYLQSKDSFWFTGARNLIMNIVLILSIIISNGNIYILALGYSSATVVVWALGSIEAKRKSLKLKYKIRWNEDIKTITRIAIPVFATQTIVELNLLIDRNFASVLGSGMVSVFNYANKVYVLFVAIFAQAFATAIFPDLSAIGGINEKKYSEMVRQSLEIILLIMIPLAFFVGFNAQDIIEIIFMRGAFSQSDANITANVLCIYALAMPAVSLTELLNKCFYAIKKTKQPMWASVIALFLNIAGNFGFIYLWGYKGLAISTVISTWGLALILMICLIGEIKEFEVQRILSNIAKIAISALLAAGSIGILDHYFSLFVNNLITKILFLGVEFLLMVLLYLVIAHVLKIPHIKNIPKVLTKILNR